MISLIIMDMGAACIHAARCFCQLRMRPDGGPIPIMRRLPPSNLHKPFDARHPGMRALMANFHEGNYSFMERMHLEKRSGPKETHQSSRYLGEGCPKVGF